MELQTGNPVSFIARPAITQGQLNAYAEASGDPNKIHLDEVVAKSMGLPGVIAHGMLSAAFIGERAQLVAQECLASRGFKITRFQTRFKAMVLLGDQISVGGTVKEATDAKVVLELQAKNQKDELVTSGTVEFSRA